jgi:hypothetical protein
MNAKEGLCDLDSRVHWGMQCSPGKGRNKHAGRVGEHMRKVIRREETTDLDVK